MLARLVSSCGHLSAAATAPAGPPAARDLLAMVAASIAHDTRADEHTRKRIEAHLQRLIERYGLLEHAFHALDIGARRHPDISHERCHAWASVLAAHQSQVDAAVKRFPMLSMHLSSWWSSRAAAAESLLQSIDIWRNAPIDDAAPVVSQPVPVAPALHIGLDDIVLHEHDEDESAIERWIDECKRLSDASHASRARTLPPAVRAAAERLKSDADPSRRALGCIALGQSTEADEALSVLRAGAAEREYFDRLGDRAFLDARYDDAAEAYRAARAAGASDSATIRSLAAALLRSPKPSVESNLKAAIDLLSETIRATTAPAAERAIFETMLGAAWLRYPGQDRDADLRRAIEHLEAAIASSDRADDPITWAEAHEELGNAWLALPSGRRMENVQRAMTCFERSMQVWTRESAPDKWASLQNHLGQAWERLPGGDRAANIDRAIMHFNAALELRSRGADPQAWASLQNNLGNAYTQRLTGDQHENITQAINYHQHALEVWSSAGRRLEWAATQNNLGTAWAMLPAAHEEREKNLRRAIAAYKAALEVRTRAAYPAEWASTHNNLGSALMHLAHAGDPAILNEAIACFGRALEIRSKDIYPVDWAKSQANLGHAWSKCAENRNDSLQLAVEHYDRALTVITSAAHPHLHEYIAQRRAECLDALDERQIMGR